MVFRPLVTRQPTAEIAAQCKCLQMHHEMSFSSLFNTIKVYTRVKNPWMVSNVFKLTLNIRSFNKSGQN